ncbi:MAG: hypothetical protein AAF960_02320 [Bacteroidota bacterium]
MKQPPVILLAFASARNDKELRFLSEEYEQISKVLATASKDNLCEVVPIPYATLDKILAKFREFKDRVAIFHYAGHANDYKLHLETPFGTRDIVYAKGFAAYLGAQRGLQLVFLNGCATQAQGELLEAHIPIAITTKNKVSDDIAMQFAVDFYAELGVGCSIGEAYQRTVSLLQSRKRAAKITLRDAPLRPELRKREKNEWILQTQSVDKQGADWSLPQATLKPLYPYQLSVEPKFSAQPFPEQRAYTLEEVAIFWGRDYEISDFLNSILDEDSPDFLLLYGASGVGKTSLIQAGVLPRIPQNQILYNSVVTKQPLSIRLLDLIENNTLETVDNGLQYIVLDAPLPSPLEILPILKRFISDTKPKVKCIISLPTSEVNRWAKTITTGTSFSYQSIYLPPLSKWGMQEIFNGLENKFNTRFEDNLTNQVISHFESDNTAPLTSLFQIFVKRLWEKAKNLHNTKPKLTFDLYQKSYERIWEDFIHEQLRSIDPKGHESGLLLNILKDSLGNTATTQRYLPKKQITDEYPHLHLPIESIIAQLVQKRLLSDPAQDQLPQGDFIKIRHQLLQPILCQLLMNSSKSGQVVRQILQHHLAHDSILTTTELTKVETNLQTIPPLSDAKNALIDRSRRRHQVKSQKTVICAWKIGIALGLSLAFVFFGGSVFLFVFLMFLVGFYR